VNSGKLFVAWQLADRVGPVVLVDEVVPVRDEVPERAAVVAERHAALHAARALGLQLGHGLLHEELAEVLHALLGRAVARVVALDLQERAVLAHQTVASCSAAASASTRL
jgi:hypothetical protein